MSVYSLKRNDLAGALALYRTGKLSRDEVRVLLMLQDNPRALLAAMSAPVRTDAEWDESLHPRGPDGKFGEGGGGAAAKPKGEGGGAAKAVYGTWATGSFTRTGAYKPEHNTPAHKAARELLQQSKGLDDALKSFNGENVPEELHTEHGVVRTSEVRAALESFRPKPLPEGERMITVQHSTTRERANQILREGVIHEGKPMNLARERFQNGEHAEFAPGRGLSGGIYVGTDTSGFGPVTLSIDVPESWLHVPPESSILGETSPRNALTTPDGAVILEGIPASAIREVGAPMPTDKPFKGGEIGERVVDGARQFNSKGAAADWAKRTGLSDDGAGERSPTSRDTTPLGKYIHASSVANTPLRGGQESDVTKGLDAIMKPVPDTVTTYRGVRSGPLSKAKVGDVIDEPGFMSTSLSANTAEGFATRRKQDQSPSADERRILMFDVPKGTPAVWASDHEAELLIGRGHRLEVLSIEDHPIRDSQGQPPASGPREIKFVRAKLLPPKVRKDAGEGSRIRQLVEQAAATLRASLNNRELEELVSRFAQDTSRHQRVQLGRQAKAALGIDVFVADRRTPTLIEGFVAENVALIKGISDNVANDIEKAATRAVQSGIRHETLAEELEDRFDFNEARARLIARDQVGKLYAQIDQSRTQELGVTRFYWRTVGDARVRDEHADLAEASDAGVTYSYADPPLDKHGVAILPGSAILCRCSGEPVYDDILNMIDPEGATPVVDPTPDDT